jgi:AraC family transcriptional regulator
VSTSRIQMISKGRRVPFFSAPDFSSADHPWAGYLFEETETPNESVSRHSWHRTTLFLCTGGQGTNYWKHRGIWHEDHVRPGSLFIARAHSEIEARRATNSWPTMVLQLDNSRLAHLAPDQVSAIENSLVSAMATYDDRLAALMLAVREEVREGCTSGRLYGEAISLALLAYLAGAYATPRHVDDTETLLSPAQKRKVAEYIRANLTSNISVSELAALAQMSPSHFARVFKMSFGVSPYRFVMRERVEGAKTMLMSAKLSASEIGTAFGFASQSHFAKVFRQFTGVTPKQYRAGF